MYFCIMRDVSFLSNSKKKKVILASESKLIVIHKMQNL